MQKDFERWMLLAIALCLASQFSADAQDELKVSESELWRKGEDYAVQTVFSRGESQILMRTMVFRGNDVFQTSHRFQFNGKTLIAEFKRPMPVHTFRTTFSRAAHEFDCDVIDVDLDSDRRSDLLLFQMGTDSRLGEAFVFDGTGNWQPVPTEICDEARSKASEPREECDNLIDAYLRQLNERPKQ